MPTEVKVEFFYATGLEDCSGGCFEQFIRGEWQRLSDHMFKGIKKKGASNRNRFKIWKPGKERWKTAWGRTVK